MQQNKNKSRLQIFFALLFWLLGTLFHLRFSNWLAAPVQFSPGTIIPKDFVPWLFLLSSISILGFLVYQARRGEHFVISIFTWILIFGLVILINETLLTTPLENIHYLQYGIISWLLANALDPNRNFSPCFAILLLTTFLGIVDETNQYVYLAKDYGNYLDFNDFLLNQLGATIGLFIHYGFQSNEGIAPKPKHRINIIIGSIYTTALLLIGILNSNGFLQLKASHLIPSGGMTYDNAQWQFYLEREPELLGYWHQSFSGGEYYVLSASEWLFYFFTGIIVFYWLVQRQRLVN